MKQKQKKQRKKPKITGKNPSCGGIHLRIPRFVCWLKEKRVRAHSAMIDPKTKSEWPHFFVVIQHSGRSGLSFVFFFLVAPYNLCHHRCRVAVFSIFFTIFFWFISLNFIIITTIIFSFFVVFFFFSSFGFG